MKPRSAGRAAREAAAARKASPVSRWPSAVEASLCAVAMAVPLAVLDGATGPYDDPKAWALPILVAVAVAAWVGEARDWRSLVSSPPGRAGGALRALVLAWLAWLVLTTATSIAPTQSVFGNFGRGMGLLTALSAGTLFFLVRAHCRTRERVEAMVDAALIGSAPVCLLGLGQWAGWNPLPVSWDPAVADLRVRSTFGQHILLGSYLVLLIPLAAARLEAEWRRRREAPTAAAVPRVPVSVLVGLTWVTGVIGIVWLAYRWPAVWWVIVPWGMAGAVAVAAVRKRSEAATHAGLAAVLLGALLVAQIAVLVLSQARGPLLGLLLAAAVAGFILALRRRAWKAMVAGGLMAAVLGGGLALLNTPGSPLRPLARTAMLARLGDLSRAQPGTPVWFRLRVWEGFLGGLRDQARGVPLLPGTSPRARLIAGYGLETQLTSVNPLAQRSMGRMVATVERVRLTYVVDRLHNMLFDHVATTGLAGAALWLAMVVALVVTGISGIRASASVDETGLRVGSLAALLAHLAEGQVGIVTPTALALFWTAAAWLTAPAWGGSPSPAAPHPSGVRWRAALGATVVVTLLVAWASTTWLLSSTAYARGVVLGVSQRLPEALAAFQRSRELMPWLPLPAEAVAEAGVRLAAAEPDQVRRARYLLEAERALAELRRHALPGATAWYLTAQVAFAQARAGARTKLPQSLEAFAMAAPLAPNNTLLLGQWGWALLIAGDPGQARQVAERALDLSPRRRNWLAWAVLSRAARDLGDRQTARDAASRARRQVPPQARPVAERIMARPSVPRPPGASGGPPPGKPVPGSR